MMSLKKIKKKKFILKHFNKKIIKSTSEVQEIELNENQVYFNIIPRHCLSKENSNSLYLMLQLPWIYFKLSIT